MKVTMNKLGIFLSAFIFTMIFLTPVFAAATEDSRPSSSMLDFFKGYFLDVGIAIKQLRLDVYDNSSGDLHGTMTGDLKIIPYLNIGTPFTYIYESNFGYNLLFGFSGFDMKTQEIGNEDINLGTSAEGYFFYATPILFYNFGDKAIVDGKGHTLKVGIDFGVGYLKASGDIILTGSPSQRKITFDEEKLTLAYGLMLDYRINRWAFNLKFVGPEISANQHDYILFDFSLSMAYSIGLWE